MNLSLTQSISDRIIHRSVLENGMVVIAVENPAADIVAARIFVRAGTRTEAPEQAGLSHLLAAVLTKGTQQLSSLEIAERIESVGASLTPDTTADYFMLSLKTVSADFQEMLALAGEVLRSPSCPEEEVALERRLTLQGIRSQMEQPFALAFDQLRHAMYLDHPYGVSVLGTEATVSRFTREDLLQYHQTYFRPDNIIVSVSGRFAPSEAIALVKEVFADWQAPSTPIAPLNLPPIQSQPCQVITPQETQQSIVMLGYLTPAVTGADYAAIKLLNTYLGNGLSSRLFVELREKRGLAYDVSAFYPTRLDLSQFVVYIGTAPENTAIAMAGLRNEVDRLCTTRLTNDELQAAKNKLLGQYALGKQTNAQIAQIFGWYESLGLGIEFDTHFITAVENVTAEMAQAAAMRYFIEPYLSVIGPAAAVHALTA